MNEEQYGTLLAAMQQLMSKMDRIERLTTGAMGLVNVEFEKE